MFRGWVCHSLQWFFQSTQEYLEFAAPQPQCHAQERASRQSGHAIKGHGHSNHRPGDAHIAQWPLRGRDAWRNCTDVHLEIEQTSSKMKSFVIGSAGNRYFVMPQFVTDLFLTHCVLRIHGQCQLPYAMMFMYLIVSTRTMSPQPRREAHALVRNDAGRAYNTWPKMLDDWVPPESWFWFHQCWSFTYYVLQYRKVYVYCMYI